jgi:type VI secretion system secreted protein VgrG
MVATYTQKHRQLEITTPLGPNVLLLTGFTGREAISQLFEFRLTLLAENHRTIAFDKLLGQPVTVRLALSANSNRYFHGIVSRFSQGQRDADFTRYTAHVVPQLWLLTKKSQCRTFQHQSVPEILKAVLAGLPTDFHGIQGKFHSRDYCVQYRETDYAFVSRLMEEEGIYYFFKHTDEGHTMYLANSPDGHPEVPRQPNVVYDAVEGGIREDFRVTSWEKVQEVRSGKVSLRDHTFEVPRSRLEAARNIVRDVMAGKVIHSMEVGNNSALELHDFPGGYAGRFDGVEPGGSERPNDVERAFDDSERTASIRMQQEAAQGLVIRAAGNCRHFVSGHRFMLEHHFDADGPYVITSIEHDAEVINNYRTGDAPKFDYVNRFSCIPLSLPFRPQRVTPRPRVEGTQTATVVGPKGEEIFCDKYGRVKVQFHWDRHGKFDAASSCWARVATSWAGSKWGLIHIPRIGQEVVVDFLEGNPDEPIIVGSVFNAEHMPPHDLPAQKKVSGLTTNSTPGGGGYNGLIFDDTKGKEQVVLHAQYDMNSTVLHDQTVTVKNDRTTTVEGTSTEMITKDTAITIKNGKYDHKVAAGPATYHVEGDLKETYNGGQTTTVAKAIVIESTSDKVHITAAKEIKLTTGESCLVLMSDGTIVLSGKTITSSATAAHEILGKPVKIN